MRHIVEIAGKLGIANSDLHPYGHHMAKIDLAAMDRPRASDAPSKLVLVSAITPTPAGEGKTTTSIGLADALARSGRRATLALREPSLGPCFGIKGGGTGGGKATLAPADRINLHFTGDFHAITAAHNLLAATLDNALHFDQMNIESRRVLWRRAIDMNDRALRDVVIGLGGKTHGRPRQTGFDITAASELMAMLCLTDSFEDLRTRIDRTLVAFTRDGRPVLAGELGVTGAMLALMRDCLMPNLVQTAEGTPALVHGGPFANIAHGCNSVIATRMGLHTADWVVTEAGFGFDLGAEKFFDIKCRHAGLDPAAVVLVASVRALRMHGHADHGFAQADAAAVKRGLANLDKHVESIAIFGKTPVIALNVMEGDSKAELEIIHAHCADHGLAVAECHHFARGGEGAATLAEHVADIAASGSPAFTPLYSLDVPVPDKICLVAQKMYGARDVAYTKAAQRDLEDIERLGYSHLPICIAKTQSSLSDDPKLHGRPRDFEVTVRSIQIDAGAGFLVVSTGAILRMPGLPREPQARAIDLVDGVVTGLR